MRLKQISKPFVVLLNSVKPYSKETSRLAADMTEKYDVSVMPVNCDQLKQEDVNRIFESILKEFPVKEIDFNTPAWSTGSAIKTLAEKGTLSGGTSDA